MVWLRDARMDEDQANHQHGHLFQELKQRFPEVPDSVVTSLMRQYGFIREKCIEALGFESNKYLYGAPESDRTSTVTHHINNLHLSGALTRQRSNSGGNAGQMRPRSDSVESRGSVGSNCSNTSGGKTGANMGSGSTPTTPSRDYHPGGIAGQYVRSSPGQTKSENRDGFVGGYGMPVTESGQQTQGHAVSNSWLHMWPPNAQSSASQQGFHISQTGSPPYQPSGYNQAAGGSSMPYLPVSTSGGPISLPPYAAQMVQAGQYVPPWPYDPAASTARPSRPGPFVQGFSPHANSVYTQNTSSSQPHNYPTPHYGQSSESGYPQVSANTPSPQGGSAYPRLAYVHISGANGPPVATETSPGNPPAGYWYGPGTGQGNMDQVYQGYTGQCYQGGHGQQPGSGSSTPTHTVTTSPPNLPTPGWSSRAGPQPTSLLVTSEGDRAGAHLQHPLHVMQQMPRAALPDSGLVPRRLSEDLAYTEALLVHQKERMCKLEKDMQQGRASLETIRAEVDNLERDLQEKQYKSSSSFPKPEDVQKLREENRRLIIDIQLMTRELDMYNNGQTPLGVIDPLEQQSFYSNIGSTGQRGSVHAGGDLYLQERNDSANYVSGPPPRPTPPIPSNPRAGGDPPAGVVAPLAQPDPDPDPEPDEGENWNCSACTFLNHPALDHCETCDMPRNKTIVYR